VKLGVVAERDLAQACRDHFSPKVNYVLWVLCEIAIAACDLAEVIGSAIALNLLFGIPLTWGIVITIVDVLLILFLQHKGFRWLEAVVAALILTIFGCFMYEIILSKPDVFPLLSGLVPQKEIVTNPSMLYIAIGIIGATVMPHNLYLHSSIVQTRNYERNAEGKKEAIKFATIDSTLSLFMAFFINAAILIVAAATFHTTGNHHVAEITDAHQLLAPICIFCNSIISVWSKLDFDRDFSRTNCDGRFPESQIETVAEKADHKTHRCNSGFGGNHYLWRKRNC
jgi:manganese transport protein